MRVDVDQHRRAALQDFVESGKYGCYLAGVELRCKFLVRTSGNRKGL